MTVINDISAASDERIAWADGSWPPSNDRPASPPASDGEFDALPVAQRARSLLAEAAEGNPGDRRSTAS